MGKYNVDAESDSPDRRVEIKRSDLTAIIESSIEKALADTEGDRFENAGLVDKPALLRMAATTSQIGAGAWLLVSYDDEDYYCDEPETICGCALWEAGKVQAGYGGEPLPSVLNNFVSAYDNAMSAKFGSGVIHATVVEG